MKLVIGDELQLVREKIACPQLGDDHYGAWGALNIDQRLTIARMISTIEYLEGEVRRVHSSVPVREG